ncbi:MAG: iron-containing alcohol dehydrogenase [Spirochaetaceae bacterium]|nr:iron-containing alcohol dehydrogenase [Spirochaetaceae bacterium]
MMLLNQFFCRIYQGAFKLAMPILPYRNPVIFSNVKECVPLFNKLKLERVLLVTDSFLRSSGITKSLEEYMQQNELDCVVYDKTCPNPTVKNVEEAKQLYVENKCQAIIAFGGGSSMDCAKATGACIAYPKKTLEQMKGLLKVWRKLPPIVAIPTTAGTGSEVTVTAVITNPEEKHKYTMNNFTMIPSYAILDPEVTYSLPKSLTATTGMDALTHAVEAYIGNSTTKETRSLALDATKLVFENIQTAYNDAKNQKARACMLKAAYKAGLAFSKSYVGYIHAVAHSLGGQYNIPHGLANSVLMPIVLEKYGKCVYKKLKELSIAAGIGMESDTPEEAARNFISAIRQLNKEMGIPEKLAGIKEEDIKIMAKHASQEANPLYPVPKLMNAKQLEQFYYDVME